MAHSRYRLLVVNADLGAGQALSALFVEHGFLVLHADTFELGIRRAKTYHPDASILDMGLADRVGLEVIEKIRAWSSMPIIVLNERPLEDQRLAAFERGADDCVSKPFSSAELVARVRAAIRRAARSDQPNASVCLGNTIVELGTRTARHCSGETVKLTRMEYRILECLIRHAPGIATQRQILREVWGPCQNDIRSLRVHVMNLRCKLEPDPLIPRHILTEAGVGYRLVAAAAADTLGYRPNVRATSRIQGISPASFISEDAGAL
jgi:two-component system, OmpR family, KDP operon response regulator KdpE